MQTFLSFESSNDDQIIESSENELAVKILQENQKYVLIDGPKKSGKSLLAKKFSRINNKKIIYDIPLKLDFDTGVYLDLNSLPLKSENFFHFLQHFMSNNLSLTIFSSHSFDYDFSNFEVIPDILSRLKLFTLITINSPQDQLLFQLIEKFLKNNIFKTLIAPDKYLATKKYLGYSPKIVSYNSGKLEIEIEGLYNEKQFHFLINFF